MFDHIEGPAVQRGAAVTVTQDLPLIDHHCHGLLAYDIPHDEFRVLATESDWLGPEGTETLDSPFGLAVRRLCAPLLGLERHTPIEEYLARRTELGHEAVHRALMPGTGTGRFIIDSGFRASAVMEPEEMATATGTPADEIVRIETIAEAVAEETDAGGFTAEFRTRIREAARTAVGFKSIVAYRFGFDLAAEAPSEGEVRRALDGWYARDGQHGRWRIDDPVLLQHLLWETVALQMPIQLHVGYGDSDVSLFRADPSRLTDFLSATRTSGATFMLLHCYPFVREAAILAQVFPHVYFDVGLVSHYTGPSVITSLREALEITPFSKLLYSSDAYGLAEHYVVSSHLWRAGVGRILDEWIADDWVSGADAERFARMMAGGNAERAYGLTPAVS